MKKLIIGAILTLTSLTASAAWYKVNVTRKGSNVYKTTSGLYIITKYCYEYSYGESAILKYEKYGYDNKLIFDSGSSCDVEAVR